MYRKWHYPLHVSSLYTLLLTVGAIAVSAIGLIRLTPAYEKFSADWYAVCKCAYTPNV